MYHVIYTYSNMHKHIKYKSIHGNKNPDYNSGEGGKRKR